jgi:chitinase
MQCSKPEREVGAAFYARAFGGVRDRDHGLYQPYRKYLTTYDWPQLVTDYIDRNGYRRYWDAQAQAPYLWNARTRTFISYEDPQSLRAKARYAKAHHLGGVMYWEQSLDPDNPLFDALAGARAMSRAISAGCVVWPRRCPASFRR